MVAAMVPVTTPATKVVKSMEEEEEVEDVVVAFMLPEQLSTAAPRSEKKNAYKILPCLQEIFASIDPYLVQKKKC
jgi:hypothetical protein